MVDGVQLWPEARTSHASCINKDIMYVHGGSSLNEKINCDSLWSLELKAMKWQKLSQKGGATIVSGLYGHSLSYYEGDLYLFGGSIGLQYFRNFLRYSLVAKEW